jgi:hypothetical protein
MQSGGTQQLRIGDHNTEVVDSFVYLGSCITRDNDEYIVIQRRLKLVNKAYFSLLAVMRCEDIQKKTKVMLYKTLICTVLTYGSKTWTLSKKVRKCSKYFRKEDIKENPWSSSGKRSVEVLIQQGIV